MGEEFIEKLAGKGGTEFCGWVFRLCGCLGMCGASVTIFLIIMFCLDWQDIEIQPELSDTLTVEQQQYTMTAFESSLNSTILPNFRAVAF